MSGEPVSYGSTQPMYGVTGGLVPHTLSDLGLATRLALVLSERYTHVITLRKEGSDEVYKYASGIELNV